MARPKGEEEPTIVQIKLRLYESQHADLLRFFRSLEPGDKPQAVIARLRNGAPAQDAPTDTEEFDADLSSFFA